MSGLKLSSLSQIKVLLHIFSLCFQNFGIGVGFINSHDFESTSSFATQWSHIMYVTYELIWLDLYYDASK